MNLSRLLEQIAETRQRLFAEGHLNEKFTALENSGKRYGSVLFAEKALDDFFGRTAEVLTNMEQELKESHLDSSLLLKLNSELQGYCIRVGAAKVHSMVNKLENLIVFGMGSHQGYRNDRQSLQEALREVMLERERFKNKIKLYFKMNEWDPPIEIYDNPGFEDEESTDEE